VSGNKIRNRTSQNKSEALPFLEKGMRNVAGFFVFYLPVRYAQHINDSFLSSTLTVHFMPTLSPSPRERFALASILFLSVHILRELWAYYENWRSASRVLEEEVSAALEVLSATPE
jgi:hypothetical protein